MKSNGKKYINQQFKKYFGKLRGTIAEGKAFGERALDNIEGNPVVTRTSSIITNTDCEFIILEKEAYLKITEAYNSEFTSRKNFLLDTLPNFGSLK